MALLPGDDGPYVFGSPCRPLDGETLLDYLCRRFDYRDRAQWLERIDAGDVLLEGSARPDPGLLLADGWSLACIHRDFREDPVPTDWRILSCGEGWMSLAKPAGMPVHSTPRIYRQSLVWQVRRLFGEDWSPVHRLDRDTSGLVLFARGRMLPRWLNKAFADRRVRKTYLALVHGRLEADVTVDAPLGDALEGEVSIRQAVRPDGKEAATAFEVVGPGPLGGTWVRAKPRQGRLHQIRVHCQHLGHPIVGDLLYDGAGAEGYLRRIRGGGGPGPEGRMWLHALRLDLEPRPPGTLPARLECPPESGFLASFGMVDWQL